MSIENSLERIADALEIIAKAKADPAPAAAEAATEPAAKPAAKPSKPKATKSEKPAAKPKAKEPEDEGDDDGDENQGPYLADVRKALTDLAKRTDGDTARGVLKDVGGADTLSKLPEAKYKDVIEAAELS